MSRKIDTLVAEHIFDCKLPETCVSGMALHLFDEQIPNFSTDIAAAWEVVKKLNLLDDLVLTGYDDSWWVYEKQSLGWINQVELEKYVDKTESVPMAICLAALKLKGINVEDLCESD